MNRHVFRRSFVDLERIGSIPGEAEDFQFRYQAVRGQEPPTR